MEIINTIEYDEVVDEYGNLKSGFTTSHNDTKRLIFPMIFKETPEGFIPYTITGYDKYATR